MKKMIALLLALIMVFALVACGNTNTPSTPSDTPSSSTPGSNTPSSDKPVESDKPTEPTLEPHTLAVAFASMSTADMMMKDYLENTLGKAYNTKFVFSEQLEDTDSVISFLETAYASGAEGIIVFPTDGLEQIIAKANELGMYIVTNAAKLQDSVKEMPYYVGSVSSGAALTAASYRSIVEQMVSDGEKHNVIIVSGGAGMGSNQHLLCTQAVLEVLQDTYGLTYSTPIADMARSTSKIEVDTGTDTKIFIYPGFPQSDAYVPGMSSMLQTGEYDTVICCFNVFGQFSVAIDEVEKAYGKNIRVVSLAAVDEATKNAFETKDAFGNPSIDAVVVKPLCGMAGEMFAVLYNAVEGNLDQIREVPGQASMYTFPMWYAYGADEFAGLANLDNSPETYAFKPEDIANLLVSNNPSLDYKTFYDTFYNCTVQYLLSK